jgi:hypothetical protein
MRHRRELLLTGQQQPSGLLMRFLCIAFYRKSERVIVGLPDTVGYLYMLEYLPETNWLFFFPCSRPEFYDAVDTEPDGKVKKIYVKTEGLRDLWIWGAFGMPGEVFHQLYNLWITRSPRDEYFGTLVNAYIESGGEAVGVREGESYVDVGTLNGYREAMRLLSGNAHLVV